jgi:hypothetical protein
MHVVNWMMKAVLREAVAGTMEQFISRRKSQQVLRLRCWLPVVVVAFFLRPACAQEDLKSLVTAPSLPPYQWFASTDPKHQNDDYLLLKPGETRRIPLAAGNLVRLWSTAIKPEKIVLVLQNGKSIDLLRGGRAGLGKFHGKALIFYPTVRDPQAVRVLNSGASLIATNRDKEPNKFFYQVEVRPASSPAKPVFELGNAVDEKTVSGSVEPRQELELALPKQGAVRDIEIEVNPLTLETLRDLRLWATWDEGATRAVDAPLLSFTGQFQRLDSIGNAGASFDGKKLHLRWLMPYRKNARLSIFNSGDEAVQVKASRRVALVNVWPRGWDYRFCAAYGSTLTQKGKLIDMLHVSGQGAFVGLALGIKPTTASPRRTFTFLEGNETIVADGKKYEGTGTEDFFNSAWYFPEEPFTEAYHGMTFKGGLPPTVSAYRFMIPDAVPFKKSLDFQFEHARLNNSNDLEYRWVAFWYQKTPLSFRVSDTLDSGTQSTPQGGAPIDSPATESLSKKLIFAALGAILFVVVFRVAARLRRGSSSP